MAKKSPKYYLEWWNIRKSTIYIAVGGVILIAAVFFGGMWASRNNWFVATDTLAFPKDSARIVSFEGEVRVTRASTRETILVTQLTYVSPGDTIQTRADGRATLKMIDGSDFSVGPNSTVVIRDTTSFFGGKDVRVSLDDGQLNVRTDIQPDDVRNIVEVAESENRLMSQTDASFNADSQNNAGEIRISRGGVETTIGGQKTTIGENEYAAMSDGRISNREKLLTPPRPVSPNNSSQIADPAGAGVNVGFSWQDPEGGAAASYHFQVSRSPVFASDAIMVDRTGMTTREYRLASVMPGTYYWRLKATARSGQTTSWNDAWKFTVVRRGGSGAIDAAEWNVEAVGGNVFLVSGKTRPGMIVRSLGRETFAGPDGAFRLQISTPSPEAAVEIGDELGNRSGFVISLRNGRLLRRY